MEKRLLGGHVLVAEVVLIGSVTTVDLLEIKRSINLHRFMMMKIGKTFSLVSPSIFDDS